MIMAVTLLHQRQRTVEPLRHGDVITATDEDYVIARRLLSDPLGRALGGALPDAVATLAGGFGRHTGKRNSRRPPPEKTTASSPVRAK
jgi:hypothetical protein